VAQRSAVPYSAVPYSAVPYSAAPYSPAPSSAVPYSGTPQHGSSQAPRSGREAYIARSGYEGYEGRKPSEQHEGRKPSEHEGRKPAYRDDLSSTGSHPRLRDRPPADRAVHERLNERPRPVHSEHAPVSAAPSQYSQPATNEYHTGEYRSHQPEVAPPAYPASWGWAPEASASRPEWRSGPRARFTSR
jgi:hypothetical protein